MFLRLLPGETRALGGHGAGWGSRVSVCPCIAREQQPAAPRLPCVPLSLKAARVPLEVLLLGTPGPD